MNLAITSLQQNNALYKDLVRPKTVRNYHLFDSYFRDRYGSRNSFLPIDYHSPTSTFLLLIVLQLIA